MRAPVVAVFVADGAGHFAPMRAVISGLAERGAAVHVFTAARFASEVEAAGGFFVDLFAGRPLAAVDDESLPIVSRYVTFAGVHGEAVLREVQALGATLIVNETFAVVGRAVAIALGLPYVNLSANHGLIPGPYVESLRRERPVVTSERCRRAVEVLRDRFGMTDASPFSYLTGLSPHLNLLPEPPEWISPEVRTAFDPFACFGSLPPLRQLEAPRSPSGFRGDGAPKIYVSLGTVPWWYWPELAADALQTIAATLGSSTDLLLTLGGADVPAERVAALRRAGATVLPYADTWAALGEADLFISAQGLNSTHESVFSGVPMLSLPFHGDQPGLARYCERLGIAVSLTTTPRAPLSADALRAGVAAVEERRAAFTQALDRARGWELDVIAARGGVIDRMLALPQE